MSETKRASGSSPSRAEQNEGLKQYLLALELASEPTITERLRRPSTMHPRPGVGADDTSPRWPGRQGAREPGKF